MKKALLFWLALVTAVFGQEEKVAEIVGLRVLALGHLPPHVEEMVNGERVAIWKTFERPPEEIFLKNTDGQLMAMDLRLLESTGRIEVPGGETEVFLLAGDKSVAKPWTKMTLPMAGEYLAVMTKSLELEKRDWRMVDTLLLNEGVSVFPVGSIRFVNTSKRVVAFKIGESKAFSVQPGKVVIRRNSEERVQISVAQKNQEGAYKLVFKNEVVIRNGERCSFFSFDGNDLKGKVKVFWKSEKVEKVLGGVLNAEGDLPDILSAVPKEDLGRKGSPTVTKKINRGDVVSEEGQKLVDLGGLEVRTSFAGDPLVQVPDRPVKLHSERIRSATNRSGSGGIKESRLDLVLPLVLLAVFVFFGIRWALLWDASVRNQ